MSAEYDDDRPGMMRIHIVQQRAQALCEAYTRDQLRALARERGSHIGHSVKADLAFGVALTGVVAPGYDKASER